MQRSSEFGKSSNNCLSGDITVRNQDTNICSMSLGLDVYRVRAISLKVRVCLSEQYPLHRVGSLD